MGNNLVEKPPEVLPLQEESIGTKVSYAGKSMVLNQIWRRKWSLVSIVSIGITNSIISFLLTLIIGDFFILQFHTSSNKGKLLTFLGINISSINSFFLIFTFLILLKLVSQFIEKFGSLKEGERLAKKVRENLFSAQVLTDEDFFSQRPAGQYLLRYSNDLKSIQLFLTKGILTSAKDLLFIGMGVTLLLILNNRLGSIVLAFIVFSFLLFALISKFQKLWVVKSRSRRSLLLAYVSKNFHRFSRMKKNESEASVIQGFNNRSKELYEANIDTSRFEGLIDSASSFLHFSMIGLVLLLITNSYIVINVSDALSCILLLMLMQGATRRLFKSPSYINKGLLSIKKVETLMKPSVVIKGSVFSDAQTA